MISPDFQTQYVRIFAAGGLGTGVKQENISRGDLAKRWGKHPTAAVRIMERFGYSGIKLGEAKQASRLFELQAVFDVEKQSRILASGIQKRLKEKRPRAHANPSKKEGFSDFERSRAG